MSTSEENPTPHTDADYYGFFMTALFGLVDDAELSGYSSEATALLRQAQELFSARVQDTPPECLDGRSSCLAASAPSWRIISFAEAQSSHSVSISGRAPLAGERQDRGLSKVLSDVHHKAARAGGAHMKLRY